MMHELHHCAQLGWGMGVHDLDDAFEHIIDHGNGPTGTPDGITVETASAFAQQGRFSTPLKLR